MGNAPGNNLALVHVLGKAGELAGASMAASRTPEDRFQEIANGRTVGNMTINLDFTVAAATTGYYEYAVVKFEKQTAVPTLGAGNMPSSADMAATGLQQAIRNDAPGWVIEYNTIALTGGSNRSKVIKCRWGKYNKAKVRDGDFFMLIIFNRSDANGPYDVQIRYRTYTVI